jgi:hypothetical protein
VTTKVRESEMQELSALARDRVVFAGRIFVYISRDLGEGTGCSTYWTAEDDFKSCFHACACTPGELVLSRFGIAEDEDGA